MIGKKFKVHDMIVSGRLPQSAFAPVELERIVYEDADTIAFYDRYPVSPGHALVLAKTVTASLFDLPPETQAALWRTVATVRDLLQQRHQPNGFNIGLNNGPAAGQTINHAQIHIIRRCSGPGSRLFICAGLNLVGIGFILSLFEASSYRGPS
jgi:diadenosine tetraphosphate (Ap4A) HIT family hydrolase